MGVVIEEGIKYSEVSARLLDGFVERTFPAVYEQTGVSVYGLLGTVVEVGMTYMDVTLKLLGVG